MIILEALKQLRDDLKLWCTNNFNHKLNKNLGTDNASMFLVTDTDGEITTADVIATQDELNYLQGTTSNVQEQLNNLGTVANGKANVEHTHNYAGSETAGGVANFAYTNQPIITSGTGEAYIATVPSITTLTAGVNFVMIPHIESTTTSPTLNINGLGEKNIRRRSAWTTDATTVGARNNWLSSQKPVTVIYNGEYWIVEGFDRPAATDLSGAVSILQGGTGAQSVEVARENLGLDTAYSACDGYDTTKGTIEQRFNELGFDTAPNACAACADYDINKGTIEERLTALGFKEGAVTLPDGCTVNQSTTTEGEFISLNYLKRQGNYVIGQLSCNAPASGFPLRNHSEYSYFLVGTVPSDFLPDVDKTKSILATFYYTVSAVNLVENIELLFLETGEILLRAANATKVVINFGYEAEPLSS